MLFSMIAKNMFLSFQTLSCLFVPAITAFPFWNVFEQSPLAPSFFNAHGIVTELEKSFVIPDVLDPSFKPHFTLTPFYKQHNDTVSLGNTISPAKTTHRPDIYMHDLSFTKDQAGVFDRSSSLQIKISPLSPTRTFKPNTTFALILTDPDATSHAKPVKAQMCHWVVTAITNQTVSKDDDNDDDDEQYSASGSMVFTASNNRDPKTPPNVHELIEYLPPSPPPKTGLHRYVFVLLAQKHGHEGEVVKIPKDRPHWGYGKQGKGVREWAKKNHLEAVGANFFYAENEKQ